MHDLVVVGAGIFGSYAVRFARARGLDVVLVDDGRPESASPAAAGLFKPEWVKKYGALGMEGMVAIERFRLPAFDVDFTRREDGKRETLRCLPPRSILVSPDRRDRVTGIFPAASGGLRVLTPAAALEAKTVYVATGVWVAELLTDIEVRRKTGTTFTFAQQAEPVIWTWAPYKQALAFERDPGRAHFSDGTAILAKNYRPEVYQAATLARAREAGLSHVSGSHTGHRPYAQAGLYSANCGRGCSWERAASAAGPCSVRRSPPGS